MVNSKAGLTSRAYEALREEGEGVLKGVKTNNVTLLVIGRFNVDAIRSLEAEGVKVLSLEGEGSCIKLNLELPVGSATRVLERIDSWVRQSGGLLIPPLEVV
ncbi:MAG: hypothetical protein QXQ28_02185 [Candidatus Nezhaarchaeales archaeon]